MDYWLVITFWRRGWDEASDFSQFEGVKRTHWGEIYFNQPDLWRQLSRRLLTTWTNTYFSPRPSEMVERFKFHSPNRKEGEGVKTYVAALRKVSEHCNYGETLPEMLRDRLVCGINNEKMQRRLLAEPDLTLKRAEESF